MGDRLAKIDMDRKVGRGSVPLCVGELGPHQTQSRLGRGLPPNQVHPNPPSRLATTDMDRKVGAEFCAPLRGGELTQCRLC